MEQTIDKHAVVALIAKLLQISTDNQGLMRQRADFDLAISSNNARIADCEAGLRAFGHNLAQEGVWDALFQSYVEDLNDYLLATPGKGPGEIENVPPSIIDARLAPAQTSIAKLLLERLEEIGAKGSKSLPLRDWLRKTHNIETHYKTVGMSLYRLSQDSPPKVHRKGHIWFFGPPPVEQPKDPGAGAPGQLDILS